MASRKPNILIMIPSGKPYQHDRIMIYDQVRNDYINSYFNVGDMMVYDSTLKLLEFSNLHVLKIVEPTEADIEIYNSQFDYVFLRASNFIHEHMQWEKAEWVLERLTIPVYALGVGAQAETKRRIKLSDQSRRVWSLISDRSSSIGVRGSFSAEVLADNGITNIEVVGCPSLFRSCNRDLQIRRKSPDEIRRVAFSLRRETSHYYSADMASFVSRQRDLLLRIAHSYDTLVTIHGEPEEKAFFVNDRKGMAAATEKFRRSGWFDDQTEARMVELYNRQLFLNDRVEDYDHMIKNQDFAIGYRVHGVLPALANGTPGALVDYDSRSGELAETFSIPRATDEEFLKRPFDEIFDPTQFNDFERKFPNNYDRFKGLMEKNSIAHRM